MRSRVAMLAIAAVCAIAPPASAQPPQWPEKFWVSVGGGVQPVSNSFSDDFTKPLYTEDEQVSVDYAIKSGALVAGSVGYRVWKRLAFGVGVTYYSSSGDAGVEAELPHPFFDRQFRHVSGTTPASRDETGAHIMAAWLLPLSNRFRVILSGGPSVLNVSQTLVTDVQFSETFPYDTAVFTGASKTKASNTAIGFNAGADLFWMFSARIGAGGLVQYTHGSAKLRAGDRTISVDAGGPQIAAGLRFIF
jgi:hypothetical protein